MSLISRLLKGMGRDNQKALADIGLGPSGYQAARGLPPIVWEHYSIGTKVKIVASAGKAAWRYVTAQNMTGIVEGIVQGPSSEGPDSDLYKVRLDAPKNPGKPVAYLMFHEISEMV